MLWSFLKQHKKAKIIVFMSSCKQVKFVYEMFSKLRPGIAMLSLYGTLSQDRRVTVYNEFLRKPNVVLFATDIASRGLDFPEVQWVLQLDCPEDVVAYIHRAGRTARFDAKGDNLLVLLPSEREGMLKELQVRNFEISTYFGCPSKFYIMNILPFQNRQIPIEEIHIDPKYLFSPRLKMESFLAQKKDLKDTAQRAFIAYIKSVVLMKNKKIFKVDALNLDGFARSLGLVITPRVRFLDRLNKRKKKTTEFNFDADGETKKTLELGPSNAERVNKVTTFDSDAEEVDEEDEVDDGQVNGKKKLQTTTVDDDDSASSDDEDFMRVKRKNHGIDGEQDGGDGDNSDAPDEEEILHLPQSKKKLQAKPLTKASLAKKVLKKKIVANKKVVFDEEGEVKADPTKQLLSELGKTYEEEDAEGGIDIEKAKLLLREEDKFDKARFKELVKARKEKKMEKRLAKEKKKKQQQEGEDDESDADQEQDDFGSDEDGDEPDLSWLPDPDQIYGKSSGSDEDEEVFHRPPEKLIEKKKKRKQESAAEEEPEMEEEVVVKKPQKAKKRKPNLAEDLSLNEAEAIALKLLNG